MINFTRLVSLNCTYVLKSPSPQLKYRQQRNSPATIEYEKRKKIEYLQFCSASVVDSGYVTICAAYKSIFQILHFIKSSWRIAENLKE